MYRKIHFFMLNSTYLYQNRKDNYKRSIIPNEETKLVLSLGGSGEAKHYFSCHRLKYRLNALDLKIYH
jgi:hypothetical protein